MKDNVDIQTLPPEPPTSDSEAFEGLESMPVDTSKVSTPEEVGLETPTKPLPTSSIDATKDKLGRIFDPEIHDSGPDGQGIFVKTGKRKGLWRRKPGGFHPKSALNVDDKDNANNVEPFSKVVEPSKVDRQTFTLEQEATEGGVAIAESIFMVCQSFGGEDWKPTDNERSIMTNAWSKYCLVTGGFDPPPSLMIAFAGATYAGPRLHLESTQSILKKAGNAMKKGVAWFGRLLAKRKAR